VLEEIANAAGEIIVFIDELHTIVGAGAAEGAVDAANMLKPMLARGELRCVGATTLDEYRKHIEKDAALERRFQPVFVGEPSVSDTIAILRGLKERYEAHHKVRIRDAALVAAAVLSERYIADRQLPDKAIDLVDEAASRLKMEIESSPVELDEANRRVTQLEIELAALGGESDEVRAPLEAELAEAKERATGSPRAGRARRRRSTGSARSRSRSMRCGWRPSGRSAKATSSASPRSATASCRRSRRSSRSATRSRPARWSRRRSTRTTSPPSWRAGRASPSIAARGRDREARPDGEPAAPARRRQDEAVEASRTRSARAHGLQDPNRPIGSFVFLGPTGVGRPSSRALWPSSCSTTSTRWCGST
jgi:ATP-dependent Clp protease ATP-binding subunit ClpB